MSATKILWGQILVVTLIVLATTWGATQYVAWQLGFQAQLGTPWFKLGGVSVYYPPAFFWWWYFYDAYAPEVFAKGGMISASGGFIAIAVAIGMSVWRAREAKSAATYGSARWAEKEEVKAAGLLSPETRHVRTAAGAVCPCPWGKLARHVMTYSLNTLNASAAAKSPPRTGAARFGHEVSLLVGLLALRRSWLGLAGAAACLVVWAPQSVQALRDHLGVLALAPQAPPGDLPVSPTA